MKNNSIIYKLIGVFALLTVVTSALFFAKIPNNNIACAENLPVTSAQAMCLMEVNSKRVLLEKDSQIKLPEASLTKIITAIVVIENNPDLDKLVEIKKEATKIEGSSIYLTEGEHLTIRELLYGLMLRSGNDAAVALAIETSGSVDEFIKLANAFCKEIGANNTNLVTPHGLHDDEHYTTAYDLALISSYALKNETFKEIVGTKQIKINNESKGGQRVLKNKNKLLTNLKSATGVKTGYTKKAGRCFIGSAEKDDMEVVCVLLNCGPMFEECQTLLEYALNNYTMVELIEPYQTKEIHVINSSDNFVQVYSREGFSYPLTQGELTNIHYEDNLPNNITAPVNKNEKIGEINVLLENDLLFSSKFYTMNSVESNDYLSKLEKIINGLA